MKRTLILLLLCVTMASGQESGIGRRGGRTLGGRSGVTRAVSGVVTYVITASTGANGSISPSGLDTVTAGANAQFTFTPSAHYHLASLLIDGVANTDSTSTYTFKVVSASHTIAVTWAIDTYAITVTQGSNGTIAPGTTAVNYNASQAFTITSNSGYGIDSVLVDGTNNATAVSTGAYTFSNVSATHTLRGVFYDSSIVNVKRAPYLATGDGVTNDIAAIDTAMGAAFAQGKALWFPSGTYCVGDNGTPDRAKVRMKAGMRVFGNGPTSIIKRIAVSGNLWNACVGIDYTSLYADSTRNIFSIDHLKIQGASGRGHEAPGTSNDDGGLQFFTGGNTRIWRAYIDNVTVRDVNKEAIAVWDCDSCAVTNCHIVNANHDAYNWAVRRLYMANNYADSVSFGLEYFGHWRYALADTISRATISQNRFTHVYDYGIKVEAGDTVLIDKNYLQSYDTTACYSSQGHGIFLDLAVSGYGTRNTAKLTISNDTIDGFVQASIGNVNQGVASTDGVVKDLFITNNVLTNAGGCAISFLMYSTAKIGFLSVTSDSIHDWNKIGQGNSWSLSAIALTNVDSSNISSNRIYNNSVAKERNDPLWVDAGRKISFKSNVLTGPASHDYPGIYVFLHRTLPWGLDTNDSNINLYGIWNVHHVDTLTASTGANGTISPTGTSFVFDGDNQTYTMTPSASYTNDSTTVDGVKVAPSGTYTFTNVQANHTIVAAFKVEVTAPATDYVGFWPMNNSWNDASGGGINLTPSSDSCYFVTPGHGGRAYAGYVSNSSYLYGGDTTNFNLTTDGSLCAWINTPSTASHKTVFGKGDYNTDRNGYTMEIAGADRFNVELASATAFQLKYWRTDSGTLTDGAWHFIAVTWDAANNLHGYVDGEETELPVSRTVTPASNRYVLWIGNSHVYNAYLVHCRLNDLRIYNRALTPTEITAIYNWTW